MTAPQHTPVEPVAEPTPEMSEADQSLRAEIELRMRRNDRRLAARGELARVSDAYALLDTIETSESMTPHVRNAYHTVMLDLTRRNFALKKEIVDLTDE